MEQHRIEVFRLHLGPHSSKAVAAHSREVGQRESARFPLGEYRRRRAQNMPITGSVLHQPGRGDTPVRRDLGEVARRHRRKLAPDKVLVFQLFISYRR